MGFGPLMKCHQLRQNAEVKCLVRAHSGSVKSKKKPHFQNVFDEVSSRYIEGVFMERSSLSTLVWVAIGAFIAALAYVPVFLIGNPGPLSPLPIYALIIFFIAGHSSILVLPVLFTIQFLVLHQRHNFLKIQAVFLAVLWVLTPLYFWGSWDYGMRWMGEFHTFAVFAVHVLGLAVLSGLAWIGFQKKSSAFNNALNILSFFFLFWGGFPILGEMP